MTEKLRCRYCHRPIDTNPLNERFMAGDICFFRHASREERELRSAMGSAHGTLQVPHDRYISAEELLAAAGEWLEISDHPVAAPYVRAAHLLAGLHGLTLPNR